ncbi:hypothetical protein [Jannaschia sp. R86511]|uniref:hypothetical protein n=1 Tax=Jannaschia sp. R86511 TaxID=3093853 RepID=UPI0036D2D110
MDEDYELAEARAELQAAIGELPAEFVARLPTDAQGEPVLEIVWGLYRHERLAPREVSWTELRTLSREEGHAVAEAHDEVYRATRGIDGYLAFAWGDLRNARDEVLRQMHQDSRPHEWMPPLINYRIINFSAALKMYYEYTVARVNRTKDTDLKTKVLAEFSDTYDSSFQYRLAFSLRNALQHGEPNLVSLTMTTRVAGDGETTEAEVQAHLNKDAFIATRANAAVRREVGDTRSEIDLFECAENAYARFEDLHSRLVPMLHPSAAAAAALIARYVRENNGERPHFHEYIRGLPTRGLLQTKTLDTAGFEYVASQAGREVASSESPAVDASSALPTYFPDRAD